MVDSATLHAALKRYWGYDQFRPKQEAIIQSLLGGQDCAVVMPTGGGKSLCYQLPAVLSGSTALVISPLIALMKDQVEQLSQMGIPAGQLNSSMDWPEQREVMVQAARGAFRLMYLSPERLAREDTMEWLKRVPLGLFAIDEAHCISEWGHEFRPEYRMLARLRDSFPDVPIAAFTASATQRVRHEILSLLKLRHPQRFITSFYRPNLRYLVKECNADQQEKLLRAALEEHDGENAIVYAPTIKSVDMTSAMLRRFGIDNVIYHGQMDSEDRRTNQERWMSDDVRVLVGTLAFGLGINKPTVRAVIHLAMPKSLEQYYQEAGRAGRDGEPADCVLLWRKADIGLLVHFIKQLQDKREASRAWDRLRQIQGFAEGDECRPRTICQHFGETPKWDKCGQCDVCQGFPDWLEAVEHKKKVKLKQKDEADVGLVDRLKKWRRDTAQKKGVPAYVILHDAVIVAIAADLPGCREDLLEVAGIGERKADLYGDDILRIVAGR